jgi:hypothetical protein
MMQDYVARCKEVRKRLEERQEFAMEEALNKVCAQLSYQQAATLGELSQLSYNASMGEVVRAMKKVFADDAWQTLAERVGMKGINLLTSLAADAVRAVFEVIDEMSGVSNVQFFMQMTAAGNKVRYLQTPTTYLLSHETIAKQNAKEDNLFGNVDHLSIQRLVDTLTVLPDGIQGQIVAKKYLAMPCEEVGQGTIKELMDELANIRTGEFKWKVVLDVRGKVGVSKPYLVRST